MTRSLWVRAPKGGVGKSTTAIALVNMLEMHNLRPQLIDADYDETKTHAAGKAGASLSAVFGERVQKFRIAPTAAAVERDVNSVYRHWFPLFKVMSKQDTLVDFGANTMGAVDAAIEAGGWDDEFRDAGVEIDCLIPLTTHPESLDNGLAAITSTMRVLPRARIYMVLVEKDGSFDDYQSHPLVQQMMKFVENDGVEVIPVPRCTSPLWRPMELAGLDFHRVVEWAKRDRAELAQQLGMEPSDVKLGLTKLAPWFQDLHGHCERVGLLRAAA